MCQGLNHQQNAKAFAVFLAGMGRYELQGAEEDEQAPEEAPPVVIEDVILLSDPELLQIIKVSISTKPICSGHAGLRLGY